jgi:HD-like signal output (HDOD) protein
MAPTDKKSDIDRLIRQVEMSDISSIRVVLSQIIQVATAPNSSAFDLKEAIEADPPLASRVLKRVNSAHYGIARRGSGVSDIHMAVVFMGFETIKELALSQSICTLFRSDKTMYGYSRVALWEHCVATATTGRLIYRREYQMPGGQIHAAGLLHDIGIIVEDQCAQAPFRQALRALSESPDHSLYHHERNIFGFSHAHVGKALADRWNFPASLSQAIGTETFPAGDFDNDSKLLAATVLVASWATQLRNLGFVESPQVDEDMLLDPLQRLGISRRGLNLILDEVEEELGRMRNEGWL